MTFAEETIEKITEMLKELSEADVHRVFRLTKILHNDTNRGE